MSRKITLSYKKNYERKRQERRRSRDQCIVSFPISVFTATSFGSLCQLWSRLDTTCLPHGWLGQAKGGTARLGKCIGRMCRKCPTALVKLHKLTVSTKAKLHDAVEKIMNEDRWQCHSLTSQSRKRNLSSSSDEEESYVAEPQINSPIGSARPRKELFLKHPK